MRMLRYEIKAHHHNQYESLKSHYYFQIASKYNKALIPLLVNLLLKDTSFLVRGAAIWALQQLDNKNNLTSIKKQHLSIEKNNDVLVEWNLKAN